MKEWFVYNPLVLSLLGLTIIFLLYQLVYYWIMYIHPLRKHCSGTFNTNDRNFSLPAVSVIVYADKRSDELRRNLPQILDQDYPDFEVVVVNDGADPDVKDVINYYQNTYKHLYSTYIPLHTQYVDHKKLALTLGIKAARHEVLLFTEADCCPVSKNWISSMLRSGILQGKSFVFGNSHYSKGKGMLYQLTTYAALKKHLRCWSSLFTRKPLLDNSRNMACLKSVLLNKDASSCGIDLRVGRRELISSGIVTRENVTLAVEPDSAVTVTSPVLYSSLKENMLALIGLQRYYDGKALFFGRLGLIVNNLLPLVAVVLMVLSIVIHSWGILAVVLLLLLIRYGIKMAVMHKMAGLLHQPSMLSAHPFLEMSTQAVTSYLRILCLFQK